MQPTDKVRLELIKEGFTPTETAICNCRYYFRNHYDSGHMVQINRNKKMSNDYEGLSEIYIYDRQSNIALHREFSNLTIDKLNSWLELENVSNDI